MKVIFLDIDGVLNSHVHQHAHLKEREEFIKGLNGRVDMTPEEWIDYCWHMLDSEAMRILNLIVEVSKAKVVISSSWRNAYPWYAILGSFKKMGFQGQIIDKTPRHVEAAGSERGHQIQAWLNEHPEVEEFVILDDDSDMVHLMPKLVHTSWRDGLLKEHLDPALKLLGI